MDKEKLNTLVAGAQGGDSAALNALFTETYNDVYYFALKTVKNEAVAADVTQDTFITVFQSIATLKDPAAYPAWSRQITYRHCLQHLKKQSRETTVDENDDGGTVFDTIQEDRTEFIPDEQLDKEDFRQTILSMVDDLPEEQRTAVLLYYFDELSVRQIAEVQGVSEGTVKSRLSYARKAIRSAVEEYEKKHCVKLHSVGVLPLLLWLFGTDAATCTLPTAAASTVASGVTAATGTPLAVSRTVGSGVKAAGALWQKLVAGLVTATVAVGGAATVVHTRHREASAEPVATGTSTVVGAASRSATTTAPTEPVSQKEQIWQGKGYIHIGLNLSGENEFILAVRQMDTEYIEGTLTVNVADGSSYQREFAGPGAVPDTFFVGSVFYKVTLNEEIPGWLSDYPGYTELTLRYLQEEDCFSFSGIVFEAELSRA